jgi:uncharacterized membrane protein YkoI
MKINRFIALAAIALLAIGAMGFTATKAFAQAPQPTAQPQGGQQVEEQVGGGQPDGAEASGAPDSGAQDPTYAASIAVGQAATEGMSEADEAAALQSKATISAADAEAAALAANSGATVVKTELDNENGALVYSVELSNGADVKVDAGNGAILFTDSGADNEG